MCGDTTERGHGRVCAPQEYLVRNPHITQSRYSNQELSDYGGGWGGRAECGEGRECSAEEYLVRKHHITQSSFSNQELTDDGRG